MGSTTVAKTKQGYGYRYTDLAEIHIYLESIGWKYYQYIDPVGEFDYIYTVPIEILPDGSTKEYAARRGCRIVQATLSGKTNPAQENGSAITYARRYSLLMAFGLACDDDDGESLTVVQNKPQQKTQAKPAPQSKPIPQAQQPQAQPTPQKTEAQLNQEMIDKTDKRLLVTDDNVMSRAQYDLLIEQIARTGAMQDVVKYAKTDDLTTLTSSKCIAILNGLIKRPTKG